MSSKHVEVAIIGGGIVGTYLARLLVRQGADIVLIERGSRNLSARKTERPELEYAERIHMGSSLARNHILGGNGSYWGGGLIRPDQTQFGMCVGATGVLRDADREDLEHYFEEVEDTLDLRRFARRAARSNYAANSVWAAAEIVVLAGKSRNLSAEAVTELDEGRSCTILTDAQIVRFERSGSGTTIEKLVIEAGGETVEILADRFVITAGAIDSNLIIAQHREELGLPKSAPVGIGLHDHFSIPLFRVDARHSPEFRVAIAPKFMGSHVLGRRFETRLGGPDGIGGLVHFQFLFDQAAPYRQLKDLLSRRQRREGPVRLAGGALKVLPHLPRLARIGLERCGRGRLHISPDVPIVATLDFESVSSPANRVEIRSLSRAKLSWDIRTEDIVAFNALLRRAIEFLGDFIGKYGLAMQPLADFNEPTLCLRHLEHKVTDAFHLGGGLAVGTLVDSQLSLMGLENLHVISTAVFGRPGLVNPVLTLLSLATRFAATCRRNLRT